MFIDAALITFATVLTAQLLIGAFNGEAAASSGPDKQLIPSVSEEADRHAIAISPLAISGKESEAQSISVQIVDHLTESLLGKDELIVVSRSAFDPSRRAGEAARDVDSILEGSIHVDDSDVRISFYLVDADSDAYLFDKVYSLQDAGPAGLHAIVEQTTLEILRVLTDAGTSARPNAAPAVVAASLSRSVDF